MIMDGELQWKEPTQRKCWMTVSESVLEDRNKITTECFGLADTWQETKLYNALCFRIAVTNN